jgi:predicted phage baseplate assembly protein
MPLQDIQLDDRRFDQLVQEAKRRIPRYTPEWTDHHESDPGITLLELFAWLTEMMLYRLNRVPKKNYIKFLELIGIELNPPTPAHVELTFTLASSNQPMNQLIPGGTKVSLADQTDGGPVVFETDDNLNATNAELKAIQGFDGGQFELLTELNSVEGKFFFPFGKYPQKGSSLFLGFAKPFPGGRHRLMIHVYTKDLMEEGQGVGAADLEPPPPVVAAWEYWAGEQLKWQPLRLLKDDTRAFTRSGFVQFEMPTAPRFVAAKVGLVNREQDQPLNWVRYRIQDVLGRGYEMAPRLEEVLTNTITATNALTEEDEVVGASTGQPNQEFRLAHAPVLPQDLAFGIESDEEEDSGFRRGSLVLEVDEGDGFQVWVQQKDFSRSGPSDPHYTLDLATGTVRFGNGEQGKIPSVLVPGDRIALSTLAEGSAGGEEELLANIRARRYRWGGGVRGNAGANTITSLETSIPYVDSVTNRRPAIGGKDEETLDEAKLRAPQAIRSRSRAVTGEDFEFLATQTPRARIKRAHALPLHHPHYNVKRPAGSGLPAKVVPIPGVVTVLVIPDSLDPKPMPNEDTCTQVARWIKRHAVVTTEVYVAPPTYRRIRVEARIQAKPTANVGLLTELLTKKFMQYFHPLTGGSDGMGWPFGEKIYFSEVYRLILSMDDVARVEAHDVRIFVDEQQIADCTDQDLEDHEVVYSTEHKIEVSYGL